MAFNPGIAKKMAKDIANVADTGANIINTLADGRTRRGEIRKEGETNRIINANHAETEDWCTEIETKANIIINALNVASDIYSKISNTVNVSKEIKLKIEEHKNNFELDKQKLDIELKKDLEKLQNEKQKNNNDHEENMTRIKMWHEQEMKRISSTKEIINKLLEIVNNLIIEDPTNPAINTFISQLSIPLNSLNMYNNAGYIEG